MDEALSAQEAVSGKLLPDGSFIANFHRDQSGEADFGMGCNMSFRRDALIRGGAFDERYSGGFYREEGDAFAQVKKQGYTVRFAADALCHHRVNPSGGCRKDALLPRMYSTFRNETLFFLNCMQLWNFPRFAYRLLRWMKATVHSQEHVPSTFFYFLRALPEGIAAHFTQRRDRVSRVLGIVPPSSIESAGSGA